MPVLIAAHPFDIEAVRLLAAKLREGGGEIRAYLEEDDHELRGVGCKVAVGRLDDASNLIAALTNVHTLVAFVPDATSIERDLDAFRSFADALVQAASEQRLPQTIVAVPGLRPNGHSVSELASRLEREMQERADPVCVVRTAVLIVPERDGDPSEGVPEAPFTSAEDLAAAIVAADDHERIEGSYDAVSGRGAVSKMFPASGYVRAVADSGLMISNTARDLLKSE